MTFEMLVLEEGERTYDSKKGRQTEYVISVRDAGQAPGSASGAGGSQG